MSLTVTHTDAAPQDVWDVLADPRLYAAWVVGATDTRDVQGDWPAVGAVLHHTQGMLIRDTTEVLESEAPRHLRLLARARPVVVADVRIELIPVGGGTRIELREEAVGGVGGALPTAVTDPALGLRNRETVRRLSHLAEVGARLRQGA